MTNRLNKNIILLTITAIVIMSCDQLSSQSNKLKPSKQTTEVEVLSLLTISEEQEKFQLIFGAKKDTTLQLAMLVGECESQILAITMKKLNPAKPLPLDILQDAIIKFGYSVKEVVVDSLKNEIYTAKVICFKGDNNVEFVARPVDAATIAIKFDAPIFVSSDLLTR